MNICSLALPSSSPCFPSPFLQETICNVAGAPHCEELVFSLKAVLEGGQASGLCSMGFEQRMRWGLSQPLVSSEATLPAVASGRGAWELWKEVSEKEMPLLELLSLRIQFSACSLVEA